MISPNFNDGALGLGHAVLIAEDNPVNQMLIRQIVIKMGHTPTIVDNGRKAVEAWSRYPFGFILMDVQMPEMSGLQAAATIRRLEKATGKHIPIIAVTANAMPGDREACLSSGMDEYVPKPLRVAQLEAAIVRCVGPCKKPAMICLATALSRAGGDQALVRQELEVLMHHLYEDMARIEEGISRRDVPMVVESAQQLREALCRCATDTPEGVAAGIEHAGRVGDFIGAAMGLAELRKHSECLLREIDSHLNGTVSAGQN